MNGILAARPVSHFVVAARVKLNPFAMERIQRSGSRLLRRLSRSPRRTLQPAHPPSRPRTRCRSYRSPFDRPQRTLMLCGSSVTQRQINPPLKLSDMGSRSATAPTLRPASRRRRLRCARKNPRRLQFRTSRAKTVSFFVPKEQYPSRRKRKILRAKTALRMTNASEVAE